MSLQVPTHELSRLEITHNEPAVESIVAVLAEIEILRRVADSPAPEHRLGKSAIEVKAWTREGPGKPFAIGASTGEETYVQPAGEDTVYAVRGKCRRFFDLSFQQLRDPTITKIDVADIERVTYKNPFGEFAIVPDTGDEARFVEASPAISNFDSERASKNVAVLAALFAKGFIDPPLDKKLFHPNSARAEVALGGGREPLTVQVGKLNNGLLPLRTSAADQVYLVSAHLASSLIPQRKHFERSDDEMRELAQARAKPASTEARTRAPEHKHEAALPTQVPPDLMSELREVAHQQRN
jgi:hypothetical protein